ncbi:MAG: M1 family metallopeptidase [bacterium]|nr:M1 family metallopeptidase [bacterium]
MKHKITGFVLILLLLLMGTVTVGTLSAQQIDNQEEPEEETRTGELPETAVPDVLDGPVVKYSIDAQLLPAARKLMGSEILIWVNTTQNPVDHLRFHLYYNAFRSEKSTFLREARYYRKSPDDLAELKFGEIRIKEMQVIGGGDLTGNIRFIQPDDANKDDRTVIEVPLQTPVEPGKSINLKIQFELTMPQIFARTGQEDDYFFLGQWFPKIGVLQQDGLWNCHQFHRNSEFFADYGEYHVNITLPEKFVVGATGNLLKTEKHVDKTVTYTYEEKDIHDFAWTAYPDFREITEKVKLKGNNFETTIVLLLAPEHEEARDKHLSSLKFALDFFAQHIYPYPYRKITVVDPPSKGKNSTGMEYPTLITSAYSSLMPGSIKLAEMVTIHEFGHEYWYGIVGSDEFREAWLDEGVNSYFEMEIMEAYFKNSASAINSSLIKIEDWEMHRVRYAALLPGDKVNQYSWDFLTGSQYGNNVYSKAAIFLRSLQNHVGKEKMYGFFKYYAEKFKFKHPTSEDFFQTFNTFMNEDFSWAFELYINGDTKLDHAVHSLESVKVSSEGETDNWRSEVVFLRKEGYFPVKFLIKLKNGKEVTANWKEKKKWKRVVIYDSSPIEYAAIDPDFKLPLDYNFLNNSIRREPDKSFIKRLSLKFGFFFQNLMGFLAF